MRPFVALFVVLSFAVAVSAQGPKGVGGDIKPVKTKVAKVHKQKKGAPLYTVPKSQPWYRGGGPGPAGVK
jgi:hypothetical protein